MGTASHLGLWDRAQFIGKVSRLILRVRNWDPWNCPVGLKQPDQQSLSLGGGALVTKLGLHRT